MRTSTATLRPVCAFTLVWATLAAGSIITHQAAAAAPTLSWTSIIDSAVNQGDTTRVIKKMTNGDIISASDIFPGGVATMRVMRHAAATGLEVWHTDHSPGDSGDSVDDMVIDPATGDAYVAAHVTITGQASNWQVFKVRGSDGAIQWNYTFSGAANMNDTPRSICMTTDNNVVVSGMYTVASGAPCARTAKINAADGTQLWVQQATTEWQDLVHVVADHNGNAIATGFQNGTSLAATNGMTIKYNAAGGIVWNVPFNGAANDFDTNLAVAVDSVDNVYIAVESRVSSTDDNIVVARLAPANGAEQWRTSMSGAMVGTDNPIMIAADSSDDLYVLGNVYETSTTSSDSFLAKLNTAGAVQWSTTKGGTNTDGTENTRGLALNGTEVYIAATMSNVISATNQNDIYLGRFNPLNGATLWEIVYNSTGTKNDTVSTRRGSACLAVGGTDVVYVCGASQNPAATQTDGVVLKYGAAVTPVPTVTAINPTSGTTLGSTPVTITGTGFTGATGVTFRGATATSVNVTNDTTLTCTTPAGSAGTASVLVTTPGGTNTANTLYLYADPDLVVDATHSPSTFIAGQTGTLTFVVTNSGTGATSGTMNFNCPLPAGLSIQSVVSGGGWNFTSSTATTAIGTLSTSLNAGANAPSVTVNVSIAANAPASLSVSATVSGGGETNLANDTDTDPITVIYPPTVTAINPTSGTTAGGTPVTITGTNFIGATAVTIGGTAATGVSVINGGTGITCTTPAGSPGTASVLVTTPGGTNAANTLYTYATPVVVPTVIAPNKSFITATTVNLLGNVSSDGGASLIERGIVYALTSANADPIIGGSGVTKVPGSGTSTGAFTVAVSSLVANSAYTYKAYATNSAGSGYTAADTFSTIPAPGPAGPPTVAFTDANNAIFTRPGGNSFTWTISVGSTGNPNIPGTFPVVDASYYNVPAFTWNLTRGIIEYAATTAGPWTNLGVNNNPNYITVANRVFRFSDSLPADSTTTNNVGVGWHLTSPAGTVGGGTVVIPDSAPTNITTDRLILLDSASAGDLIAIATPTDTGRTQGGRWTIDAQSVGNLFTLQYDNTNSNTAMLKKGTGTVPAVGQTATLTLRYNDWFQLDANGNPTVGQGFSKTLTFTVLAGSTNSLATFASDTLVNTYTTNLQMYPAMATLSNGNYVVVWQSQGQDKTDSTKSGVYGQIFTNAGSKVGGEFVISNASGTSDEINPGVTALNAGRFAVTYSTKTGADYNIGVRTVEANGTVSSEIIGNTTTASDQTLPVIATLTDGSFVVAWVTYSTGEIRLQQFAAAAGAKVGSEVLITNVAGGPPGIAALDNGSYAASFFGATNVMVKVGAAGSVIDTGIADGSYYAPPRLAAVAGGFVMVTDTYDTPAQNYVNIRAVRYNNAGTLQGSVFTVNSNTTGGRLAPAVATLTGGGFIVVWSSDTDEGYYDGIMGRRFSATGVAADAADFQVNQYRYLDQLFPVVTGLAGNVFASAWMEQPDLNYTNSEVKTRVLLSGSAPIITVPGTTLTLSTTAAGTPGTPAVSFNISGANLTGFPGNLTVTAPTNTQVSANGTNGWASSIQIPYASATLASTPVYVRLDGNGSPGTITGNVTVAGGGATTANVAVSGILTYIPVFTSASIATDNSTYAANATITVTINTIRDQYAQPYLPSLVNVQLLDATQVIETSANLSSGQSSYSYTTSSSVAGAKTVKVTIDGIVAYSGSITITSATPSPLFTATVDAPPGAPGTSYSSIRSGAVIASSGALAFRGYLTVGGTVDANNYMGMWKSPDGTGPAVVLVTRSGNTAPDSGSALYDVLPVNPVINSAAQTTFLGMLRVSTGTPVVSTGTDSGVWSELGGLGLHLLLREGDAITGGTTGAIAPSTTVVTGDAHAAFSVKLAPAGSALVRAGVVGATVTVATIAREGDAAPAVGGGTAGNFASLGGNSSDPRMDAAGDIAFLSNLQGGGGRIYYQGVSGSLIAVMATGQASPGVAGDTIVQFERPSLGNATSIAFRAILNTTGQAVYQGNPNSLATVLPVAVSGYTNVQVPTVPAGSKLWSLWSPFSSASGRIAFRGTLVDGSNVETRCILTDASGTLAVIAKVGDTAPGTSGDTFVNFDHPAIGDGDQAAFTASTQGGVVGLWKQAAGGGALSLVVKVGDTYTINSVTETVASLIIPGASSADRTYETRCMDAAGHLLVHVTYLSGKTGILLSAP